jgi:hypothetical protein
MYRAAALALLLLLPALALGEDSSAGSRFLTPHYSVRLAGVDQEIVHMLESQGFLIEWAHGDKASLYVDAAQEELLTHLGYRPVLVETPQPNVPYPTITELYASIDAVLAGHSNICRSVIIGTSVQGRPLRAVVVSDNPAVEEVEPELRIIGAIHGDEKTAAMVTLGFLQTLTDGYSDSPMCQYIVDNTELWVVPVINPDGYVANSRYNANGIDLNRNLSYMGPGGGGGSTPFSEPETAALRDITMQDWPTVSNFINPFTVALTLHGGAACFNAPWNYTETPLPADYDLMVDQGNAYAGSPGIVGYFGSGNFDVWVPGAAWYPTNGDVNDWSYGECGTVDHTIEVHSDKQASDWPGVSSAHFGAILGFFTEGTYGIWGTVTNSSGDPLDALIQIGFSDATDSEPLRFCRTDVTLGDYCKTLLPDTYDVMATVSGYTPQTVTGVTVGASQRVEVSFVMNQVGIEGGGMGVQGPQSLSASPNPACGFCRLTLPGSGLGGSLSIYDITGRQVFRTGIAMGVSSFTWDCSDGAGAPAPAGVYVARYASGGGEFTERLVLGR